MKLAMGLTIADITFTRVLKESDSSTIFQVTVEGKTRVLKYHTTERSHADPSNREIDAFTCESTAYCRLKEKGLCQQRVVPDFYGVIKQIDPISCQPFLKPFLKDKLLPNAILIEYIPDLHEIDLSTFSDHRIATLRTILESIHGVGIYHGDPYPRNMMVQKYSERVLWIDFDHAQTFSESEWKWQWMQDEKEMVDEFLDALTKDYNDGKISRTWPYYYTYL
ncbi:conserved hypothetical protein [Talaromyces stipitatus ATCC 10500]|uniref:Protein kinase domain-containing protein n=1 Tax=Talaromyces stipitatus (strain ATCC 10500 / CBS 375.48 / QM 6759 / NRRL 1006) TaxID=441959 RepID=B8LU72_TALSN|nr:uncharacterized protein TSTA_060390 [Talaromyces stipitatus ATCC 10500]EED22545.1 conserved hypothetical protein [Talaromyces stipitatus ATCC 10500]